MAEQKTEMGKVTIDKKAETPSKDLPQTGADLAATIVQQHPGLEGFKPQKVTKLSGNVISCDLGPIDACIHPEPFVKPDAGGKIVGSTNSTKESPGFYALAGNETKPTGHFASNPKLSADLKQDATSEMLAVLLDGDRTKLPA